LEGWDDGGDERHGWRGVVLRMFVEDFKT
jgi:hypothetical protein